MSQDKSQTIGRQATSGYQPTEGGPKGPPPNQGSSVRRPTSRPPDLGRIGRLAEELRCAGRAVVSDMVRTHAGDAYEYRGSTNSVEWLIEALNNLEHFQAGWV